MALRVHELAKELKISTAALRVHLKDLGVNVKSHMSFIEDEIVDKIRKKFQDQIAAIKQQESVRKRYHHAQKLEQEKAKKRQETHTPSRQHEKPTEEKDSVDKVAAAKKEIPTFTERPIKKTPSNKPFPPRSDRPKPIDKSRPQPSFNREKPKVAPTETKPPETEDAKAQKKASGKDVKDFSDLGKKSKHLAAKLKHTRKGKKRKTFAPTEVEEAEISKNIRQTLAQSKKPKKYRKDDKRQDASDEPKTITISEFTSVSELAKIMDLAPTDIIAQFFNLGQLVTINQRLDKESLEMICDEFNFDVEFQEEYGTEILEQKKDNLSDVEMKTRPPVVTIMGHVDHGKTSILDYIREANVIAGEAGGITQHIGAYQVTHNDNKITFIDTPGHEAFSAMRSRGANITDIGIIVVAADDSVMPQTVEAIDHVKAAEVTMIVAINKIDVRDANVDRVIADLGKQNIFLEGYGGEVLWTKTSAITGEGIDELMDLIVLASEMKEIQAGYDVPGKGIVIESQKDSRIGTVVTVLMQEGTLKKSESVVCGATYGRIRKIENERGKEIKKLNPSDVGVIFGLNDVPKAGDILNVVQDEKLAKSISMERQMIRHEREKYQAQTNLNNLFQKIKEHHMTELNLIVKADFDGSVEALCDSFEKLSNDEIIVNIIRRGVGGIVEADVNLATSSDAVIIGFHVRPNNQARKLAEDNGVEIKQYQVIYDAINDLKLAIQGMLKPEFKEETLGNARVKEAFKIRKLGTIAGCAVEKGVIRKNAIVRLYRNDTMIHEGKISSLKHYDKDVEEIRAGTECGIGIENYNDIKEGDIIEASIMVEVPKELL